MSIKKEPSDYLIQDHDDEIMTEAAEQGSFLKFAIPASERLVALKELQLMNVNAFSLYGSEDSLIRTLATAGISVERRELKVADCARLNPASSSPDPGDWIP